MKPYLLDDVTIRLIAKQYVEAYMSMGALARKYFVAKSTISYALENRLPVIDPELHQRVEEVKRIRRAC